MDALATIGALAVGEGVNSMAILAPVELPPGHVTWTAKEVSTADHAFASTTPSLLTAWLATGACLVAWKEATFDSTGTNKKKNDESEEPAS